MNKNIQEIIKNAAKRYDMAYDGNSKTPKIQYDDGSIKELKQKDLSSVFHLDNHENWDGFSGRKSELSIEQEDAFNLVDGLEQEIKIYLTQHHNRDVNQMVEGILNFKGFNVERIYYTKKNIGRKGKIEVSLDFMLFLTGNTENVTAYNIILGTRIGFMEDTFPFEAGVVRGHFFLYEDQVAEHSIDDRQKFKLMNGSAILYSYLRSTLTDLTSKSSHHPIILPTLNAQKFVEQKDLSLFILSNEDNQDYDESLLVLEFIDFYNN